MWEYISFDDLLNVYGITQEELSQIDSNLIRNQSETGAEFCIDDSNTNGLPDFYDSYLGVDVVLNPPQGVAHG